jgi:putative hydrolase of the HAD superfamily
MGRRTGFLSGRFIEAGALPSATRTRRPSFQNGANHTMNKHLAYPATYTEADLRARFLHVDTWVFDLDNTLYPPDSDLWPKIDERITLFLVDRLDLDGLSARALQKHYYRQFGTTLCGLISEDSIIPAEFLSFVHDIDRSTLAPNPSLRREISALPGRKLIFTNGSRDHAVQTTAQLGLDGAFDGMFDIVDANMIPKPDIAAYEAFFARYSIDPANAAMFEDIARNLIVPKTVGMTATLVVATPGQTDHREAHDRHVDDASLADFTTSDLTGFLSAINAIWR